jgi:hypothetical protein
MKTMKIYEAKVITFLIACALVVLGILASLGILAGLSSYAFWLVVVGFVLLALGNLLKGL